MDSLNTLWCWFAIQLIPTQGRPPQPGSNKLHRASAVHRQPNPLRVTDHTSRPSASCIPSLPSSDSDTLLWTAMATITTTMGAYLALACVMALRLNGSVREGKAKEGKERERQETWKEKERGRTIF